MSRTNFCGTACAVSYKSVYQEIDTHLQLVCADIGALVSFSPALTAEEFAKGTFNHEDYANNPN
eukprot:COSAG02_NODE_2112_length_9802_cov_10.985159_15_plen_63_part_01